MGKSLYLIVRKDTVSIKLVDALFFCLYLSTRLSFYNRNYLEHFVLSDKQHIMVILQEDDHLRSRK